MSDENAPLTFRDKMSVRVRDLREHEAKFVHEFARGKNSQSDLDGENSEPGARLIMGVSVEQPAG